MSAVTLKGKNVRALCGLIAVIAVTFLPLSRWLAPHHSIPELLLVEAVWWCYAVLTLVWLRFGEQLPLASIGLRRPTWKTPLFALLGAAALVGVFTLHFAVIVPMFHLNANTAGTERSLILARPFWYRLLMVLRAAVVEEIIFRGYMIEKVRQITGSTLLAVLVSVAAFTFAHLGGWGVVQLIPVFGSGVIFALLYVWKRDLPSNMIAHFIIDGAGFLLH